MAAGDFNGDGKLDLAVAIGFCTGGVPSVPWLGVSILLGNGDGTFQPFMDYLTGPGPFSVTTGDFTGDGGLDLALANSSGNTVSVLLNRPVIALFPVKLRFGDQTVGTASAAQTVTLSNPSGAPLQINSVAIAGADPWDFAQTNSCDLAVRPGAGCALSVTFAPTAGGSRTAAVAVGDDAPGSPQFVSLSGTGTDFAISASPRWQTVTPGQTARYKLTLVPIAGFAGTVELGCAGPPLGATCSVAPASVTLNGSGAVATVTVATSALVKGGTYTLTLSGADGRLHHATAVVLQVVYVVRGG
jgi:hypothetical protein